ncbi:hypothetical protein EJ06DRAFT_350973 [Trichodelitschia bisporula]|uniref:DUF1711-domain-containing protein n=1 Tax=Trichodelitschia bisporula TaxID=703511 RepID=A0A6G1HZZ4_9PEZI|nr:hypothetical protein EJ06DRAFT_350973 [Trichodelitschia bisporula]
MSNSNSTTAASKASSSRGKSKMVALNISSGKLAQWESKVGLKSTLHSKASPSTDENSVAPSTAVAEASPPVVASDENTPVPSVSTPNANLLAPPPNPVRRKGIPGPKPGMKRTASQMAMDGAPKPRGKPGPKKKPRVSELNGSTPTGTAPPAPAHKLGPKANQGAINACLRALDRTGKPCRKWERRGFQVKSFTGITWDAPTWGANKKPMADFHGDVKSDSSQASDAKPTHQSSGVASDTNSAGEAATHAASSPAPVMANGT